MGERVIPTAGRTAEAQGDRSRRGWWFIVAVASMVAAGWLLTLNSDEGAMSDPRPEPPFSDQPDAGESSRHFGTEDQTDAAVLEFARLRDTMVEYQLARRDIHDPQVLAAMRRVPRHRFVPAHIRHEAYYDGALPIAHGQTISQPYIVALMTQLGRPTPESKALDVGTGSGYQAAVLAELCRQVYTIEIVEPLAEQAGELLAELGYQNIETRCGDGYRGWPEAAPFDLIIVAAAPKEIPPPLIQQLAPGGRLVIPVGAYTQHLTVVEKRLDGSVEQWRVIPVAFVPMTGETLRHRPQ